MLIWLPQYLRQSLSRKPVAGNEPIHIMFCFVDHFEPQWLRPDYATEVKRVDNWFTGYRTLADRHKDADGRVPQHSFFYPEEEYREEHLAKLADLCANGYGEIEVHLHHENDTAENLRTTLQNFIHTLHDNHGAFAKDPHTGKLSWAFIHGNWALCNSLPGGVACGVDEELPILRELGCYCDMTLPSAPSPAQTSTINSIYYAEDKPGQPKSHDTGAPVSVGGCASGDLMIVQGPLGLNFRKRKFGILPTIENGDIKLVSPPTPDRVDLWIKTGVHVAGKPNWIFVKIHTHGAQEGDMEACLGKPCDDMYDYLETRYNDGEHYVLHYVTARETYNIIKAAEAGKTGNPCDYRDYQIPRPNYKRLSDGGT